MVRPCLKFFEALTSDLEIMRRPLSGNQTLLVVWPKRVPEPAASTTSAALIPDFMGKTESLDLVIEAHPNVVSHNIETVERLTKQVRIQAKYQRSLEVIKYLKEKGMRTKSGIMLGLGETKEEVEQTIRDLHAHGCDVITIGQYLQPTPKHLPVERFVPPAEFAAHKLFAQSIGCKCVESGPLVRSSYHSERHLFDEA